MPTKRKSYWIAIVGGILVIFNLVTMGLLLSKPIDHVVYVAAEAATDLAWVALGVFVFLIYLKRKRADDAGETFSAPEVDTAEDSERMSKRRNWIIGFFVLYEMIGSLSTWILNNYAAGATLVNLEVIFDLVANIFFFYLVVELFRNKKNVLNILLYTTIFYIAVETVMDYMRLGWLDAAGQLPILFFFIWAIKAPLTRKSQRIAFLVVLPVAFVLSLVIWDLSNSSLSKQLRDESLLEQEYSTSNDQAGNAYGIYLQKDIPSASDIQNVETAITERNQKSQQVKSALDQLKINLDKELPSTQTMKSLILMGDTVANLQIQNQQADTVTQLMDYSASVDFKALTSEQEARIGSFKKAINDFESKITDASFIFQNDSNL